MAEPELLFPVPDDDAGPSALAQRLRPLDAPPAELAVSQPVAVYLQWLVLGSVAGAFALRYSLGAGLDALAGLLPRWSQVAGAGVMVCLALLFIERRKRDRRGPSAALGAAAAVLAGLALRTELLEGYPAGPGWFLVLAVLLCGALHLVWFEDWVSGRHGPRFVQLAAALQDLATARWWFWFSKSALARRAAETQQASELRGQRDLEQTAHSRAEYRAAAAAAERKAKEDTRTAAEAAAEAARIERSAAALQRESEEARGRAAEAEERRLAAELRVAAARKQTEELNRQAEAAALERAQLRNEQMDAERRFLTAATAAKLAAETAIERGVEAARAQELLDRIRAEIPLLDQLSH